MTLQKGGRGTGWFTAYDTSCTSCSITFIYTYVGTLYIEVDACGIIYVPVI